MHRSAPHAPAVRRFARAASLIVVAGALHSAHAAPCAVHTDDLLPVMGEALAIVAAESADPIAAQSDLLRRLAVSPKCYPNDLTREQWEAILRQYQGLPPTQFGAPPDVPGERFFHDNIVWTGNRAQGPSLQAAATFLTYSFPADGTIWGLSAISATGPNDLNAKLIAHHGAANLDLGREYFRQALASWRVNTGLDYDEVADDNTPMAQDVAPTATRGDVRIGGREFGTSQFLAYNAFPNAGGIAGVGGGDMCMNTSFFLGANFNDAANNYRYLRNTVAHEHGHGLGNIHVTPCNGSKLMEPAINTAFDVLTIDEKRGAGRNYGDRHSGNHAAANAVNYGDLTSPVLRSVIERDLSLNGLSGANNTNQDWFRFTLGSAQTVTLNATPTGGSYSNGQQLFSCFGSNTTINATNAGNLTLELRDAAGVSILDSASGAVGSGRTINAGTLSAGEYTVRVIDVGPNTNQIVQLYDMSIVVGGANAPPFPVAGISKRIAANTNCFFMGDINSRVNQPGATLNAASYEWDLDGDGAIDVSGNAKPSTQYVSNGVYPVTLFLTDSNGMTAADTITVTVFGAATSLSGVSPPSGEQGDLVPVVITGVNLKNVASASEFTVSGSGVTVVGTPISNVAGTSVTGLSFQIDAGATLGARDVSVMNADGSANGVGLFTVLAGSLVCPGDTNGDGVVDFVDFSTVLAAYGTCLGDPNYNSAADLNGDNCVDFADFSEVLAEYGADCN